MNRNDGPDCLCWVRRHSADGVVRVSQREAFDRWLKAIIAERFPEGETDDRQMELPLPPGKE